MRKFLSSHLATLLLAVLAAGLIGFGGVGAALSAPRIESDSYGAQVQLADISTSLKETNAGGTRVVAANEVEVPLLEGLVPDGEKFQIGKTYDEQLFVSNDGSIDEYVRVTVYKYWVDSEGNQIDKKTGLDPDFIQLEFVDGGDWKIDKAASTEERTVLYYQGILPKGGETSPLTKSVTISPKTLTVLTYGKYAYEGVTFRLEAVVDAVQTHNGTQAMTGAWGQTI